MATTSIADKLAKLENKIAKRQATIAEEQTQLDKELAEYDRLYLTALANKYKLSAKTCSPLSSVSMNSLKSSVTVMCPIMIRTALPRSRTMRTNRTIPLSSIVVIPIVTRTITDGKGL